MEKPKILKIIEVFYIIRMSFSLLLIILLTILSFNNHVFDSNNYLTHFIDGFLNAIAKVDIKSLTPEIAGYIIGPVILILIFMILTYIFIILRKYFGALIFIILEIIFSISTPSFGIIFLLIILIIFLVNKNVKNYLKRKREVLINKNGN